MSYLTKQLYLFSLGGILYCLIEMLWRGYTHQSMFFVGGICFVLVGLINELFTFDIPLIIQMVISGAIITLVEFVSGCILNIYLGLNVWDYSNMPFNILGQVCLTYSMLWVLLSLLAIILDDYIRYWFFKEEKPHYKFI